MTIYFVELVEKGHSIIITMSLIEQPTSQVDKDASIFQIHSEYLI